MYLTYHPLGAAGHPSIGAAGHRASSLMSYGNYSHGPMAGNVAPPYHKMAVFGRPAPAPAPENVNGGISAVLEYDPQNMSAFLSWCAFGMLGQTRNPSKDFEGVVVLILHATRLPKSTIIIALEYLNQRFSTCALGPLAERDLFLKLVVALVLANKFNDDNTFTNRLWAGATGLQIDAINHEERDWLTAVKWQLNVVKYQPNIETLEECWRTWMDKFASCAVVTPAPDYYALVPASPTYDLPLDSSPIDISYGWNQPYARNPYVAPQQSIWAYPNQYQYAPPAEYYGYGPYYSSGVAIC